MAAERGAGKKAKPAKRAKGGGKVSASKSVSTSAKNGERKRTPSSRKPSNAAPGIYPAKRMSIDAAQVQAMRERVAAAVEAGVIGAPSDEQWAMILSRHHATRIFAGAGSGKSTTLVLRIVFMLCHLNLPPERLTVISFTNASCAELRERLTRVLSFWSFELDGTQARSMVRTFHAAMAAMAREVLPPAGWFEQLDEVSSDEPDNPLAGGRLRPPQHKLLKLAYGQAYAADETFRSQVHTLLGLPAPEPIEGKGKLKAPEDVFKLAGEFTAVPLFEVFYQQAGFIESIGLRIDTLDVKALECSRKERVFLEALKRFWQAFQTLLAKRDVRTFNDGFQALTERLAKGDVPLAALLPFTHLAIDEFQDISPQIVQWLQALHRQLAKQGEPVSLMAIGDDWQSIYGWRGSSPELFMDFDRHFTSRGKAGKSSVLTLATNYRSIEPVIRDAEKVLADVAFKQEKTCHAHKSMQPGDHGVKVIAGFDLANGLPDLIAQIRAQCDEVSVRPGCDRTAVLVLGRRNEPLAGIRKKLDAALPVKALTIHRAKGLQGEVAIIVDDCLPGEKHPLRNALYAHSGFFRNSYDQAMADEALRLGYVAITRGVSRVFWYTRKRQGAVQRLS
ncbi:DNA helicase [Pseudomonas matsuisoli]|uniref:DNA helicase n=2 Tax=Pseudomonas matsuisoli TaxID=1515666 RepID=A0A917PXQ7_9PSED|nr:DNA helicase [Pseudomonas matsuisoli]